MKDTLLKALNIMCAYFILSVVVSVIALFAEPPPPREDKAPFASFGDGEGEAIIAQKLQITINDNGGNDVKIRGNMVGTTMKRPDFNQTDERKSDYIKNNPIPAITEGDEGKALVVRNGAFAFGDVAGGDSNPVTQGQYVLLEEITTEEELTQYEYIPKNNGKKNLKAVFIRLIIPKGNGTGLVNTVVSYETWYSTTIASTNMISGSSKRYFNVEGHNSYGKIQGIFWGGDNEYSANRYSPATLPTFTKSNFDKISLKAMTSGVPFPIGTNIKIYGVEE